MTETRSFWHPACARLPRRRRGQILVLLSLLIPLLLAACALGSDIAVFYYNWAQLQQAADSAALAGAAYLPGNTAEASSAAIDYATRNGAKESEIAQPAFSSGDTVITISISRVVPYYFARVLGLVSSKVSVTATAALEGTSSAGGVLPVGLDSHTTYNYGEPITLHAGGVGPGNWGGLALGCTGGSCFRDNLANGYSGTLSIGQEVPSEPGAKSGPTSQGIDDCVARGQEVDPSGTWNSFTLDDPRAAVVPVVDWTGCNGRCSVPIVGFAAIWINGASGTDINAVFIGRIAESTTPSTTAPNFGVYKAILSQ